MYIYSYMHTHRWLVPNYSMKGGIASIVAQPLKEISSLRDSKARFQVMYMQMYVYKYMYCVVSSCMRVCMYMYTHIFM